MENSPQITSAPVNKNLLGILGTAIVLSAASGCTKIEERNIDSETSREAKGGTVWLENMPTSKLTDEKIIEIKEKKRTILEKLKKTFPTLEINVDLKVYAVNDFAANPNGKTEYEVATTSIHLDNITEERIQFEVDSRNKIKSISEFKEEVGSTTVSISPYAGIVMKRLEMAYKDTTITLNNGKIIPLKSFLNNTKSVEVYGTPFQNFIITCLGDNGIKKEVKFFSKDGEVSVPRGDVISQLDLYCK